jgi:hypothetical protein
MKKVFIIAVLFLATAAITVSTTGCASKKKYGCPGAIH